MSHFGGGVALLWKLEPATAAKHRLYKRYLDAWWPIMLQPIGANQYLRPRVTYVDAFAGPGLYEDRQDGSPVFVLERLLGHTARDRMHLSRERVTVLFIERDRARHEHLKQLIVSRFGPIGELPVRVCIRRGDAGVDTEGFLTDLGAWEAPILAIFDSWGNVNIPFELMQRIASVRSSEVITTFGPNWFSRREGQEPDQLDTVFGGHEYWQPADQEQRTDERWRVWLETYRRSLERAGFPYQLQFEVVPRTGQPLYLVFGTGTGRQPDAGLTAMKEAMWNVDGDDGMGFRDPRTRGAVPEGQLDLFHDVRHDEELDELVMQRLDKGASTVEQIGTWLLRETARWRPKDARASVIRLRDSGIVAVNPAGRVTKSTRVTARR